MATDLPRFTITLPEEMYARVSDYQKQQGIKTQSKAIQRLVACGLEAVREEQPTQTPQPSELDRQYASLDAHGRKIVDAVLRIESEREPAADVIPFGTIRHYFYCPAAGPDGMISGEDYEDIPVTPETPKGADFCLTVSGDSMEPILYDGQLIYISESEPVRPLEIGVFFFQGGTYVKQYGQEPDGSVTLLSANPGREDCNVTIPPLAVPSLVCFGKVLGIKKRLPRPVYDNGSL